MRSSSDPGAGALALDVPPALSFGGVRRRLRTVLARARHAVVAFPAVDVARPGPAARAHAARRATHAVGWGRVAGAVLLAITAAAGAATTDRMVVLGEATVAAETVRLRDVAVLEGERATAAGDVELGPAPLAGESRTLEGARILDAIRRAGVDVEAVTYRIPGAVRVRRAAQDVPEGAVRALIEAHLRDTLGAGADDAILRSVELGAPIRIPTGAWSGRVVPSPGVPLVGRVRLQLELLVDDRPVKRAWVTADVQRFGPVVVAVRAVARGTVLGAEDVTVDRQDLSALPRGVVTDPGDAVGAILRTDVVAWSPIRREQLQPAAAVRRGDAVMLIAEHGGLRLTAPGEVREDALRGDRVHVTNRSSGKSLVGRVVDGRTVAIEF